MYKIAVGTTSKLKNEFFREVLAELEIEADVVPIEVSSEVSEQPMTSGETKRGSINRAKNALLKSDDCDFAVGIEVGYQSNKKGKYSMFCWTTIIDRNGGQISACSHKLLLPEFHQGILKEGKKLGEFVRQYLVENEDQLFQYIGVVIRDRKPFIQDAVRTVLLNYLIKYDLLQKFA